MNLFIDTITLFSKNGDQRKIEFERNGVNVITGESNTGKTTILSIIDYCFLASTHNIPESIINENISWYGLGICINMKEFFIARRAPIGNNVADEYFFAQANNNSIQPIANIKEDDLRDIIETEFGITGDTTVAYGGRKIKAGSKFSFRYFFLFNTISEDIITTKDVFFDKQNDDRYREALPRIFDMAMGIDDLSNIMAREKKDEFTKELIRIEKRSSHLKGKASLFQGEIHEIARQGAGFGLIDGALENPTIEDIRSMISLGYAPPTTGWAQKYEEVSSELFLTNKKIRALERLNKETGAYNKTLTTLEDSLKPITALIARKDELVKTEFFDDLIGALKSDLQQIKEDIAKKRPIDSQVSKYIKTLKEERNRLILELESIPSKPEALGSEREKWLFIGETRGRLATFDVGGGAAQGVKIRTPDDIQKEIDAITVKDVEETRMNIIRTIDEAASELKECINDVLENYGNYLPVFNYKEKKMQMRRPRSASTENYGSSSNHMFMHLLHFLALHEVAISQNSQFVPKFLVVDQPSRPYYGDDKKTDTVKAMPTTDKGKITKAFYLLDSFIARMNEIYHTPFQIIVFEHIPTSIFDNMKNVHLVEEFRDKVALIPQSWLK